MAPFSGEGYSTNNFNFATKKTIKNAGYRRLFKNFFPTNDANQNDNDRDH
jgi:hypothetical protein